jgi:hypothetical protein
MGTTLADTGGLKAKILIAHVADNCCIILFNHTFFFSMTLKKCHEAVFDYTLSQTIGDYNIALKTIEATRNNLNAQLEELMKLSLHLDDLDKHFKLHGTL